jgi:hypothetical protein
MIGESYSALSGGCRCDGTLQDLIALRIMKSKANTKTKLVWTGTIYYSVFMHHALLKNSNPSMVDSALCIHIGYS